MKSLERGPVPLPPKTSDITPLNLKLTSNWQLATRAQLTTRHDLHRSLSYHRTIVHPSTSTHAAKIPYHRTMVSTRPFDRIDQAMHSERVAGNDRIDAADSLLDMARGKENYSPNARSPLSTAVQHKELVRHPVRLSCPDQLPISSPSFPPKLDPRWMYPNGQYTVCAPINREITPSALFSGLHPATTLSPPVPAICQGFKDPRIDEYARTCPKVRAFLYQKYSYFKNEWRSEDCDYFSASTTEARENKGWKSIKNDLHCSKCYAVN